FNTFSVARMYAHPFRGHVKGSSQEKKEDILFRGIQVIIRKYQLRQALDSFPKIGVACLS
ncbi:MAG: hypothetical protein SPL49_08530, partial [Oribacterium sp.]|nr:hypothetical protein [Oribacterium sp.]